MRPITRTAPASIGNAADSPRSGESESTGGQGPEPSGGCGTGTGWLDGVSSGTGWLDGVAFGSRADGVADGLAEGAGGVSSVDERGEIVARVG